MAKGSHDKQRVLILSNHPVLGEGIQHLLKEEPAIEVVGMEAIAPECIDRVAFLRPDVVILAGGVKSPQLSQLTSHLLERFANLPLICVDLERDTVQIYHSRQVPARSRDLKEALRDLKGLSSFTSCQSGETGY
ncbi:MAG: hypothetical protein QN189_02820 [Armatimonadota bacterium]|nr:hypothetical protein [Armatimonadota bacterium]